MPKLGEFLRAQAVKAGIDLAAEANKPFVDSLATLESDVPDAIAGLINSSLISIKEAKNNHSELKNHYTRQALDQLDQNIDAQVVKFGLTDAQKDALKLEKSSYKRQELISEMIVETEKAKALADKPDLKKFNDQIVALNAELATEKQKPAQVQAQFEKQIKDLKLNYGMSSLFKDYKTIFDGLPGDARTVGLNSMLNTLLAGSGAKLELSDAGEIVLLTADGQTYHDKTTNTPLNAKQFVEKALADSKLLVTNQNGQNSDNNQNSSNGQNGQNGNQQNQNRNNNGGNGDNGNNDAVTNEIRRFNEQAAADYKNAPAMA